MYWLSAFALSTWIAVMLWATKHDFAELFGMNNKNICEPNADEEIQIMKSTAVFDI